MNNKILNKIIIFLNIIFWICITIIVFFIIFILSINLFKFLDEKNFGEIDFYIFFKKETQACKDVKIKYKESKKMIENFWFEKEAKEQINYYCN